MHNTMFGRALSPAEKRHSLYLDAVRAFGLTSGLRMEEGAGSGSGDGSGEGASGAAGSGATDSGGSTGGAGGENDPGFPKDTPVVEMTAEQQAAYWKHQSRKHEDRAKSFGNLSPDDLAALREKADRHDALERELMSDKDRAVVEARESASSEARQTWLPRLVTAEFKAAAAGRIDGDRLASILEPLDLSKFVDGDEVNADKIADFVEGIAPKAEEKPPRRGPSPVGVGHRQSTSTPSLDNGRSEYQRRHGKKPA